MKICHHCGKKNNNNDKYCKYCGATLIGERKKDDPKAGVLFYIIGVLSILLLVMGVVLLVKKKARRSEIETPSANATTEKKAEEDVDEEEPETTQELVFPGGALNYKNHHYYIYEGDARNWFEASENCKERGGYMAVINDDEENEALFDYMVKNGFDAAYFGMTDLENEGEWKYLYGDESAFTDWGYNSKGISEPNNADDGEQHAELDTHMNGGHWNDGEFGRQTYTPEGEKYKDIYAYICEWDM